MVNDSCTFNWEKLSNKLHKLEQSVLFLKINAQQKAVCYSVSNYCLTYLNIRRNMSIRPVVICKDIIWMNSRFKSFIHIPILITLLNIFFTKVFSYLILLIIYLFTNLFVIHSCIHVCFHLITRSLIDLTDLLKLMTMAFICINSYYILHLLAHPFNS